MNPRPYSAKHLGALRRFAAAITALTILGHAFLGFEQSYAQPIVAALTAYAMQILIEYADATATGRRPRYLGSPIAVVDFLLSAHISALAVAMLLYYNDRLLSVAFASATAIGSKSIFRVPVENGTRHYFNPSNFGIAVSLLLFPDSVGLVPPWHFTEELAGGLDWGLFMFIFTLGSIINGYFTKRLPLIAAWIASFALQAVVRSMFFGASVTASIAPMTGIAFVLFTFYMAPDPATTPERPRLQSLFGASIGIVYGVLMAFHVVHALFLALTIVCGGRGLLLYLKSLRIS